VKVGGRWNGTGRCPLADVDELTDSATTALLISYALCSAELWDDVSVTCCSRCGCKMPLPVSKAFLCSSWQEKRRNST
jgi:hypothetical protein